jgi:hypothetical protein
MTTNLWGFALGFVVLLLAFSSGAQSPTGPVRAVTGPNTVIIAAGDQPILKYRYGEVPFKPYAQEFLTPMGVNILRDAPHDHLHHHALMFAVGVNKVSFWGELPDSGFQRHVAFEDTPVIEAGGLSWAGLTEKLQWQLPNDGAVVLNETRRVYATRDDTAKASLVLWDSELSVPAGTESVTLTGDHYYGLGMRFLVSMDKGGEFFNSTGAFGDIVRGDERLSPAEWCAYTAEADGKRVTVVLFDCPSNPRYPALWFTMQTSFAYLSATRNLWKEPMEVKAGQPVRFRHAIALWDGKVDAASIEQLKTRINQVWK